jgi:hypothetical protein
MADFTHDSSRQSKGDTESVDHAARMQENNNITKRLSCPEKTHYVCTLPSPHTVKEFRVFLVCTLRIARKRSKPSR